MSNTNQLLSTVAGGVIGFFVGGPAGALRGAQIGFLAGSALFPGELPAQRGPRLEDFETLHADPGSPVAIVFGTAAVSGFRLYIGPATEIEATEEVGGKGGPTQEVTTYHYLQTLAIGLCEGPISGVRRIWENGKLVYDVRPQLDGESDDDYAARLEMSERYEGTFVLYLGTEDQLPDPTLELEQGAGNVPAFRGLAYIVYPNRELRKDQAERHPAFKIEVVGRGELVLTSQPYPIEVLEELAFNGEAIGGSYQPTLFESLSFDGGVLGGALSIQLVEYDNYDPETLTFDGEPLAGELRSILLAYTNWDLETMSFDGAPLSGVLDEILVQYECDVESLNFAGAPLGGTLT